MRHTTNLSSKYITLTVNIEIEITIIQCYTLLFLSALEFNLVLPPYIILFSVFY